MAGRCHQVSYLILMTTCLLLHKNGQVEKYLRVPPQLLTCEKTSITGSERSRELQDASYSCSLLKYNTSLCTLWRFWCCYCLIQFSCIFSVTMFPVVMSVKLKCSSLGVGLSMRVRNTYVILLSFQRGHISVIYMCIFIVLYIMLYIQYILIWASMIVQ